MKYLVNVAKDQGVTQDVVIAYVSLDGDVTLEGDFSKKYQNPLVQIVLEDNTQVDLNENALWIRNVLEKLKQNMVLNILILSHTRWEMFLLRNI